MITKDSIESAYCFFHQKWRVYEHSTMAWQQDDIEMAIAGYADGMNSELYARLANGTAGYLHEHRHFAAHLQDALEKLEAMM